MGPDEASDRKITRNGRERAIFFNNFWRPNDPPDPIGLKRRSMELIEVYRTLFSEILYHDFVASYLNLKIVNFALARHLLNNFWRPDDPPDSIGIKRRSIKLIEVYRT